MDQNENSFYDSDGRIINKDDAHEVALKEEQLRNTEISLAEGKDPGESEQWGKNLEFAKLIYSKYENAFEVINDPVEGELFQIRKLNFGESVEELVKRGDVRWIEENRRRTFIPYTHNPVIPNLKDLIENVVKKSSKEIKTLKKIEKLHEESDLVSPLFSQEFGFEEHQSITLSKRGIIVKSIEIKPEKYAGIKTQDEYDKMTYSVQREIYKGNLTNANIITRHFPNGLREMKKDDQIALLQAIEAIHDFYSRKDKISRNSSTLLNRTR